MAGRVGGRVACAHHASVITQLLGRMALVLEDLQLQVRQLRAGQVVVATDHGVAGPVGSAVSVIAPPVGQQVDDGAGPVEETFRRPPGRRCRGRRRRPFDSDRPAWPEERARPRRPPRRARPTRNHPAAAAPGRSSTDGFERPAPYDKRIRFGVGLRVGWATAETVVLARRQARPARRPPARRAARHL